MLKPPTRFTQRHAAAPVAPCCFILLTILCLVAALAPPTRATQPPSSLIPNPSSLIPRRVILISLDGLDVRYLREADRFGLRIPTLRRLMAGGSWAGVEGVYPSVTYPSHTTIVTGALPRRHGIYANALFEPPPAPQTRSWYWFARDIKADALWDAAARRGLKTGIVSWPVATGAGDWNVPEIWKPNTSPADSLQQTLAEIKRHARPSGIVEELERRDPALYRNVNKDEGDDMRTRFAEHIIREQRPDLMLVHLFDLDHFQHDFGPFTPEAFAILEKTDGYVARLLAASEHAGTLAETAVFVVSDHGFRPVTKLIHPGVILSKAGLLRVEERKDARGGARPAVNSWDALHHTSGGACVIILRDPRDRRARARALAAFREYEARPGARGGDGGVLRVVTAAQLKRLGADPRATFALDAAPGYAFGNNLTGAPVNDNTSRGQHGYLPAPPDYRATLIAAGAGLARRGDLGTVRMIDIAPTVARSLGLTLRDADGRPLRFRRGAR